ncbi:cysteine--tRNA ligase [Candidatus Saccharibacteria bacterium RIFCSPLOWO2_01_FULL_48_13]|nr:MAG: cysteine--tRNA ligase [Candidatus Saccharibacteria bacterium RIFCSPLOWO2_01_FULL_48_13]
MKLYNSLTKKIESVGGPDSLIKIYSCGPTVYNRVHIGNLRTYIFEDTLRRVLGLSNRRVIHVMNITDIDDKTIAASRRRYPKLAPAAALKKLTSYYEKFFFDDVELVGIDLSKSKVIKATDEIAAMKQLIRLIAHKYVGDDGVYFDISSYPNYGVLNKLDRSHQHHRINNDEYDKEHVADFALWKASKPNEPSWEFELDGQSINGRPGWHIECSAIASKYLGPDFDIHTGGIDLRFPHHENEIAQSASATGSMIAKMFVHAHHLVVDGKKMSKSLNNFYTVDDVSAKKIDPMAFRLLVLGAHYRSQLNFSWASLDSAAIRLKKYRDFASRRYQAVAPKETLAAKVVADPSNILKSVSNDLDTASALAFFDDYIEKVQGGDLTNPIFKMNDYLQFFDQLLGLNLLKTKDINLHQKSLIDKRETARLSGDWKLADKLRHELLDQGLDIRDSSGGPIWARTSY